MEPDHSRHAWMSYLVDKAPTEDALLQRQVRVWEPKEHKPVMTFSRSAYKPYSTYVITSAIDRYHMNGES